MLANISVALLVDADARPAGRLWIPSSGLFISARSLGLSLVTPTLTFGVLRSMAGGIGCIVNAVARARGAGSTGGCCRSAAWRRARRRAHVRQPADDRALRKAAVRTSPIWALATRASLQLVSADPAPQGDRRGVLARRRAGALSMAFGLRCCSRVRRPSAVGAVVIAAHAIAFGARARRSGVPRARGFVAPRRTRRSGCETAAEGRQRAGSVARCSAAAPSSAARVAPIDGNRRAGPDKRATAPGWRCR